MQGWANYLTVFPRSVAQLTLSAFKPYLLPAIFRLASCIAASLSVGACLLIINKLFHKRNEAIALSACIILSTFLLMLSRLNSPLSSISYIFYLPACVLMASLVIMGEEKAKSFDSCIDKNSKKFRQYFRRTSVYWSSFKAKSFGSNTSSQSNEYNFQIISRSGFYLSNSYSI